MYWFLLVLASATAHADSSSERVICEEARALLSPQTTAMAASYSKANENFEILICPGKKPEDCTNLGNLDVFQYLADTKQFQSLVKDANELGCHFPENAKTLDLSKPRNRECLANAILLYRPDYHFDRHAIHRLRTELNLPKEEFNQHCQAELEKNPLTRTMEAFLRVVTGRADEDDPRVASEQEQKATPSTQTETENRSQAFKAE